eukprot:GILI01014710.1.p1 GENE.GILI01014710.1~~GILI01014710.1.p1  ORF type:complete len:260 (+),score=28.06 GILI01014710.1:71-850(+)
MSFKIEEIVESEETSSHFSFHLLPPAGFKTLGTREHNELMLKWGLAPSIVFRKFRYDQNFSKWQAEAFLRDFLNDAEFKSATQLGLGDVTEVSFEELPATTLSMDFFDKLEECGVTSSTGYIKKCYEEEYEGISVTDKLRELLLVKESEQYDTFSSRERSEFLFHLFSRIVIGGSMNQYEDNVNVYLDSAKGMYKDMVNVTKDSSTGQLKISSWVFMIKGIKGSVPLFARDSPQNFAYVIVNPLQRHVSFWHYAWSTFF